MGGFQLIPLATVQYDVDVIWPNFGTGHVIGDPFDANGAVRYTGAAFPVWGGKVGGGLGNMNLDPRFGYCGQIASSPLGQAAAFFAPTLNFRPVLYQGGPSAVYQYPQWSRVWRWQVVFQLQVAVASTDGRSTFLGFIPNGGGPPSAVGNSYFGVVLGTDGRWKWVTRTGGGGFGFTEQVDLFAGVTTPHTLDFVILEANGQRAAVCQLYVDGQYTAPFLARSFAAGGVLPNYTATVVNATSWLSLVAANDVGVVTVIQLLKCRWMVGQYNPGGIPV